ncbi:exodeoxyribonuclease I [Chitinibacteraceae bacterium HSL-7]
MHTFLWHDYETFGADPRRDRPAQFAAIRTDLDLNEIEAPIEVFCQPASDYLPQPEAVLLTGITPQHCQTHGVPEHAFARAIETALGQPGTIGVGYNSIRFDDEVTRFLLWRNLRDPYAREWQNQCGRWDLLDVVRTCYALRPDGMVWPEVDGRVSFKLENLSAANGLAHDAAHDAVSDVRATIALARLIKTAQPRLFDFCLKLRSKQAVLDELNLVSPRPVLHVSGMYGTDRGNVAIVWPLAQHPTNKNEIIVWDLAFDPAELAQLNAETMRLRMFTRSDALPEGMARLPVKTIHINKSPIVIGNIKTLSPERAAHWGIDVAQAIEHARAAAALPELPWREVFARPAENGPSDVDSDLYGGFPSPRDKARMSEVTAQSGEELARNAPRFDDARLDELLLRYRARNFAGTLSDAEQARFEQLRHERLIDGVPGYLTLEAFCSEIDRLAESADERGEALLAELYDWADQLSPEF